MFLSTAFLHTSPLHPFYCMSESSFFKKTPRTIPLIWTPPSLTFLFKSGNSLPSCFYKLNLLGLLPKQIILFPSPRPANNVLRCQLFTSLEDIKSFPQVLAVFSRDDLLYQIPFWKTWLICQSHILPLCWHLLPSFKVSRLLYHLQVSHPHCQNFLLIYLLWVFPSSLSKHHPWLS